MVKILVLGSTGMLGGATYLHLIEGNKYEVGATAQNIGNVTFLNGKPNVFIFNAQKEIDVQLLDIYKHFAFDYVINCIGIIKPYCKDDDPLGVFNAIKINALFPHILAQECEKLNRNIKIIQIATDCVYSGKKGGYAENDLHDALDVYGKSKSLGEVISTNLINIRCSIIGHELKGKLSLIEWFLSNNDNQEVNGFDHHEWNGITTLQFAELCDKIIAENKFESLRKLRYVLHYIKNETVSKYEILDIFNEVYERNIKVKKVNDIGNPILRTLTSVFLPIEEESMKKALIELKNFSIRNGLYKNK